MTRSNILHFISNLTYNTKVIFVLVCSLTVILIIDTSIIKTYYFSFNQSAVGLRINLFITISSVYLISLFLLSEFAKKRSEHIRNKKAHRISTLYKIAILSQILLAGIILFVNIQILTESRYNVFLLSVATWISYVTAIITIGLLAVKFFSWFRVNKNFTVLLYGIASVMFVANASFILTFVTLILRNVTTYSFPRIGVGSPFFNVGSATNIINSGFVITSIICFMLWWIATISVLRHYSEKSKKIYWFILIIPLFYFLIQFQPLFLNLFSPLLVTQPVLFSTIYTLFFTLSKPVGGILFSITFWTLARKLSVNNPVRNYMIVSAYGLVLLFVSNQAFVLVSAPYPPFGLVTTSLLGLSSYLVFVGIYSSAISVSQDLELRQSIRNFTLRESKLLDSIGSAQFMKQVEENVIRLTKATSNEMMQQSGIQPSLTENEMRQYVVSVIQEIKSHKK
jgi:hypothetical protein